jgi:hypothetical protein
MSIYSVEYHAPHPSWCHNPLVALFSRRPRGVVQSSVIASLAEFGRAVIAAKRSTGPMTDPRFDWEFMSPVMLSMNGPLRDQVIQELYDAASADADRPMASVGAYKLLAEYDGNLRDERFLALQDTYLNLMHHVGFSSGHLTGYESNRWIETHGDLRSSFDGR